MSGWNSKSSLTLARRTLASSVFLILLTACPLKGQQSTGWTWKDKSGKAHSGAELDEILRKHREWLASEKKSGRRAELSGAYLQDAILLGTNLDEADLSDSDLRGSGMGKAGLIRANLNRAKLNFANLDGAVLDHADLRGAELSPAGLRQATMWSADFSNAKLMLAELQGVNARYVRLDGATALGANLEKAYLAESSLKHADLSNSILRGAVLSSADMTEATLTNAALSRANLQRATLTRAYMDEAQLEFTNLVQANLTGADLNRARLWGADLREADLTDANFSGAFLRQAIFEPKTLPELRGIAAAHDLEFLTYKDNPDALVQLRKQFEDDGFRQQERKLTYALKRREAELTWADCASRQPLGTDKTRAILWSANSNLANCSAFLLNRVFFDSTCQYGMSPGRPLSLGVALWVLCSLLYFLFINFSKKGGLYRIYSESLADSNPSPAKVEKISPAPLGQVRGLKRVLTFFLRQWQVLRASMFFSLRRAFNIGFQDLDFGKWLRLLTRRKYDVEAVGWARVVAGWQSLISLFLIVMWVLTYFGRPFE